MARWVSKLILCARFTVCTSLWGEGELKEVRRVCTRCALAARKHQTSRKQATKREVNPQIKRMNSGCGTQETEAREPQVCVCGKGECVGVGLSVTRGRACV